MVEDLAGEYGLWGEFEHGVDDKGRVVMPQEFRAALGEQFVLTRGPEHAIFVFPMDVWRAVESRLRGGVMDRERAFLRQMMAGSRTIVRLDPQFRLAIPKLLREWAGITQSETAVIVGQDNKLEIWSKSNWMKQMEAFTYDRLFQAAEAIGLAEVGVR
ncbi:MAG: division/cell wall cluster transcriptional repressor MraZ [Chthonomonadales bacterium]